VIFNKIDLEGNGTNEVKPIEGSHWGVIGGRREKGFQGRRGPWGNEDVDWHRLVERAKSAIDKGPGCQGQRMRLIGAGKRKETTVTKGRGGRPRQLGGSSGEEAWPGGGEMSG